jgi:ketosteroid isomerase-like protein
VNDANRDSLRRAVARWNAGDVDSALELASEDLRWYPGRDVFPDLNEVYQGKQEVRESFSSFLEPWERIDVNVLEEEEIGDEIVVRALLCARSKEGVDVNIELGQRWTFREGLLWRYRGYSSYAEAREAALAAP